MEIIVYDRNLYRLGTIENHTSLQWHRKYYECGTFELHAPATEDNIRLLQPGNVIRPKGKDEAAVIRGDQTEEESTLVNEIVRNGYFLPIYFNDRLTGPMFTFNGTCEDAIANEKAARVGKRLPDLAEWLIAAEGSPQGLDGSNTNGWTATTNTARTAVGKIKNAISVKNIMDIAGNVWEWINELCLDPTAASWNWYNVMSGYGQIYMPSQTALLALLGGGAWDNGVHCGSRAVSCYNYPCYVSTDIGVWCVCDSL